MRKKLLSWVLVIAMTLSLFPTSAFAVEGESGTPRLEASAATQNLCLGDMGTMRVHFYDEEGEEVVDPDADVQWNVDQDGYILIQDRGLSDPYHCNYYAVKPGTVTLTATLNGETTNATINIRSNELMSKGELRTINAPEGVTVTSDDEDVIMVNQAGTSVNLTAGTKTGYSRIRFRDAETDETQYSIQYLVDAGMVLFNVEGMIQSALVAKDTLPSYPGLPTKPSDTENFHYVFTGWNPELAVMDDLSEVTMYTAQFAARPVYSLEFKDEEGQPVLAIDVEAGPTAEPVKLTPTVTPNPEEYGDMVTYMSEDESIATVDADGNVTGVAAGETRIAATIGETTTYVTVNVTSQEGYYTITFNAGDWKTEKILVPEGEVPAPTFDPSERPDGETCSYRFVEWVPTPTEAYVDTTYNAMYQTVEFTANVKFKNWDGTVLQDKDYVLGATPVYEGATPTRPMDSLYAYTFEGWSPNIETITSREDIVYTAQYSYIPKSDVEYNIVLSENQHDGNVGTYFVLTAETEPEGLAQGTFQYSTSDDTVATVTETGRVDIVGPGNCVITVTDGNKQALCVVNGTQITHEITFMVDGVPVQQEDVPEGTMPVFKQGTPSKSETSECYYEFKGWTPEITTCTQDATYTAVFNEFRKVAMTLNHTTLAMEPGETAALEVIMEPEVPDADIKWSTSAMRIATVDEEGNVTAGSSSGSCVITAQYGRYQAQCTITVQAVMYEITWYVDGQDPYVTQCAKGQLPVYNKTTPTKESDVQYDYTFAGWMPELKEASDNQSYQAQFTKTLREYDTTWVIGDRRVTEKYHYGDTYNPPTDTDKEPTDFETYEFIGWDPSAPLQSTVKGSYVFEAKYLTHERSNIIIEEPAKTKLYVGDHLQLNATVKPSSMKWRWSSSDTSIATVDDEGYVTAKAVGSVTITASSLDGTYKDTVDLTVDIQKFKITWSVDGTDTVEEYVKGEIPSFKGSTDKESTDQFNFTFTGWDKPLAEVTADATYVAQYKSETRRYTITWDNGGDVTTEVYFYGSMPAFKGETVKEDTEQFAYRFNGWSPELVMVTGDKTYVAQYTQLVKQYTVTWVAGDETIQEMYDYGATPKFKGTPAKTPTNDYSYEFTGWNSPIVPVTGSATYVAQFKQTERVYTIKWVVDGKETTETYKYNELPEFKGSKDKAATKQYNYTFTGWTPVVTTVSADATYTAQYTATLRKYNITFKNYDNTILKTESVDYGVKPTPPANPTRGSTTSNGVTTTYTFKAWNPTVVAVEEDATYVATYSTSTNGSGSGSGSGTGTDTNKKKFTATFKNWDGTVLETVEVVEGTTPKYSGETPTRPISNGKRYVFSGWSPELTNISADTVYKAVFKTSSATELDLTEKEIAAMKSTGDIIIYEFPTGELYMDTDAFAELASYKRDIKMTVTEKKDVITVTIEKVATDSSNSQVITDEIPGLVFLAYDFDGSAALEVAPGKKGSFEVEPFSVITHAGGYTKIPGTCRIQESDLSRTYSDVNRGDWYYEYVTEMYSRGMMIGTTYNTFSPNADLSRAQILMILYRLSDSPTTVGGKIYSDMAPGAWFTKAAMWATKNELLPPLAEDNFGFNKAIARKDLALLLYNYAKYLGFDTSARKNLGGYRDAGLVEKGDTSGNRRAAMEWAVATGIIKGENSYTLNPDGATSRAETCTMMMRFIEWAITTPLEDAVDAMDVEVKTTSTSSSSSTKK